MSFPDTNVLLYSVSAAADETEKRETARRLLERDDLCLSTQVLQEFHVQVTRPSGRAPWSHSRATEMIESFLVRYPAQETTVALVRRALLTRERFRINYWDAAIIEAARLLGCRRVFSEDLAHRQDYGGVEVVNPFLPA